MDVMVFSFVVPTLISVWHITQGQAGLLGTSALLISSLGGWLAGLAADRFGRVKILQVTILWFAFFTFLGAAYELLPAIVGRSRPAGPRIRWRVGGWIRADGRDNSE